MTEDLDEATIEFAHRMFESARNGDAETLRTNIEGGLPVNLTNDKGDSLLILAAYHQQLDVVHVLLESGADTERTNDKGQTALGAAVFRQSEPIVRELLDAGASANAGSPSAVEVARFFELPEMEKLLR